MRANLSRDSPAGRHAVRLAVVVVATELLARHLPLQRSYWMVVAAATALRPEFGATFTRGAERILGTVAGVAIAGAIAVAFHPGPHAIVAIIALLAWAAYALFPASFAVGFAFITALIVFLLEVVTPGTFSTASDRLVDTLVGGAIGLSAYALWPTWSSTPARLALANLIAAQRGYLHVVLSSIVDGCQAPESQLRPAARAARLARTQADSAIAHSLADPATRRIDADQSQAMLAALRRLVEAIHILRIDAQGEHERIRLDTLAPLAEATDAALAHTGLALRADEPQAPDAPTPQLRELYARFAKGQDTAGGGAILLAELDEIVDAVNTLGALAGDPPVDLDPAPPGVGAA